MVGAVLANLHFPSLRFPRVSTYNKAVSSSAIYTSKSSLDSHMVKLMVYTSIFKGDSTDENDRRACLGVALTLRDVPCYTLPR